MSRAPQRLALIAPALIALAIASSVPAAVAPPASRPATPRATVARPAATPRPAAAPVAPTAPPVIAPTVAPPYVVADPLVRKLANGLTVAVFPSSRLPIVQMELLVPAGSAAEGDAPEGTAALAAQLLRTGTTSRDAATFATDLAGLGGSISASAQRDFATLSGAFLAREFESGFELLSDAALNPVFPDEQVQIARAQAQRSLAESASDPFALADQNVWAALFKGEPYGRAPLGTARALGSVTRDQISAFYHEHYRPDGALLAIAGDVTPEKAFAAAEERFGRWTGKAPVAKASAANPTATARVRIFDVPDAPGTELRVALRLPSRTSPDDQALTLAASVLGRGDDARLRGPAVASKLGTSVRSGIATLREGGVLSLSASVRTDSVAAAAELLRAQIRAFAQQPPTESELAPVRRVASETYNLSLETLGGRMGQWLGMTSLGLPAGAQDRSPERLASLDSASVAAAVRRWIDANRLVVVAVGPAGRLKPLLAAFGPVEVVEPESQEGAARADTLAATPERIAKAAELLRAALVAHGGEATLRGIHDSVVEAELSLIGQGAGVPGTLTQSRKDPMRFLTSTKVLSIETRQGLDGARGWSIGGQARAPEDADSLQVEGLRAEFASDLPHVLLGAVGSGVRAVYRGADRVDGRAVDAIDLEDAQGRDSRLYLESDTHRLAAYDQFERAAGGALFSSRRVYRDYRPQQGLVWPFEQEQQLGGQGAVLLKVQSLRVNVGLPDRLFARPSTPSAR
ncbi:MAG TPA: pitrilysin family protein [Candidatus Saccharimonadaceae bacterium]|nr:pitrilysin family protein [Candidatus Saccharimonadaceae bacterium]